MPIVVRIAPRQSSVFSRHTFRCWSPVLRICTPRLDWLRDLPKHPSRDTLLHTQILPDLVLDTPSAPSLVDMFAKQAKADGCLPPDYKPPSPPAAGDAPGNHGVDVPVKNGSDETSAC